MTRLREKSFINQNKKDLEQYLDKIYKTKFSRAESNYKKMVDDIFEGKSVGRAAYLRRHSREYKQLSLLKTICGDFSKINKKECQEKLDKYYNEILKYAEISAHNNYSNLLK